MPAVLLTGVGKRYDIVSSFAQHATVVAADPNPLAPAQYAATVRTSVPLIRDPDYVPALARLCEEHGVGAIVPLTDLDIETLAEARADGRLPQALVPDPEVAARHLRQVRDAPAARAPRAAQPADGAARAPGRARRPGDGQAAPGLGRALDPSRLHARAGRVLRRLRRRAGDGAEAHGRARVLHRPALRPRRPLPERDPAHDDRVARRRVDQGHGHRRPRARRARPRASSRRSASAARARCRPSATRTSASASPTSTRASAAPSRRRCTRRPPAGPTRSSSSAWRRAKPSTPHVGEYRSGLTFTRYFWQMELDAELRPTGRDIVAGGPPLPR